MGAGADARPVEGGEAVLNKRPRRKNRHFVARRLALPPPVERPAARLQHCSARPGLGHQYRRRSDHPKDLRCCRYCGEVEIPA